MERYFLGKISRPQKPRSERLYGTRTAGSSDGIGESGKFHPYGGSLDVPIAAKNGSFRNFITICSGKLWWDEDNQMLAFDKGIYSTAGVSAFGASTTSIQNFGLVDLSNVLLSNPQPGQALVYDGTNWVNKAVSTGNGNANLSVTTLGSGNAITAATYTNGVLSFTKGGTFALKSELPTKASWNYDDVYLKLDGNAASASKLKTPCTIWGKSFDGTADVSGDMTGVGSIAASGSIAIGVESAQGRLHIYGTTEKSSSIILENGSTSTFGLNLLGGGFTWQLSHRNGNATYADKNKLILYSHNGDNWADHITFTPERNIGVGMTDPKHKFHVNGGIVAESYVSAFGASTTPTQNIGLGDLSNVTLSNPQSNQALVYDGSKWVNKAVSTGNGNANLSVTTLGSGNAITGANYTSGALSFTMGSFLPLIGGTMANTNLVSNMNADLLDGYHATRFAQRYVGAYGQYNKVLKFTRNSEKGFLIISAFASHNGSGAGVGGEYIIQWSYDNTNANKSIAIYCLWCKGDRSANLHAELVDGKTSETTYQLYFDCGGASGFTGYSIKSYSNSCTIVNTDTSVVSALPDVNYSSSLTTLNAKVSSIEQHSIWGQTFDGTADVSGDMSNVGRIDITAAGVNTNAGNYTIRFSGGSGEWIDRYGCFHFGANNGDTSAWRVFDNTKTSSIFSVYKNGGVVVGNGTTTEKFEVKGNAKATKFIGAFEGNADTATAVLDYGDTTKTIKIGYQGSSLASFDYLAAYKEESGQVKIKDIAASDVNVGSADKLKTARTIWGRSFNGSANISGNMTGVTNINSIAYFDDTNKKASIGSNTATTQLGSRLTICGVNTTTADTIDWSLSLRNVQNGGTATLGYGVGIKLAQGGASENKWAGVAAVAGSAYSNSTELAFFAGGSERIRIEYINSTIGYGLGIGMTDIKHKLHVNGGIVAESYVSAFGASTTTLDAELNSLGVGVAPNSSYKLYVSGTSRFSGSIAQVSTTTSPSTSSTSAAVSLAGGMYIAKNLRVAGSVYYGSTPSTLSDMRFKDVIGNRLIGINEMADAPLFAFKYKSGGVAKIGTSAQYWQDIMGELVEGEDRLSLDYSALGVAMGISLAKHVKSSDERIAELESKVKDLENELKNM